MVSNIEYTARKRNGQIYFLVILFMCSTSYFFGTIFKTLYEGIFNIMMPLIILSSYYIFIRKTFFNKKNIILMIIMISLIVISYMLNQGGLGSVFNNFSSVLLMIIFYELSFNVAEMRFFTKLIFLFHLFLLAYILLFAYGENGYIGIYNSNMVAMQILLNMILINFYFINKKSVMLVHSLICLFVILFYCHSRTSLLAGILFFVLRWMYDRFKFKQWLLKCMFFLMGIFGLIIPFAYVSLYVHADHPIVTGIASFSLKYFNKYIFTGREYIWGTAWEELLRNGKNFMFGVGTHYSNSIIADANFHNSFFTIMICCGFVGYLFMMLILYRLYVKCLNYGSQQAISSCIAYLSLMFVGIFESILFVGQFAILIYLILLGIRTNNELKNM